MARDEAARRRSLIVGVGPRPDRIGFVWEWEWELPLVVALIVAELIYLGLWRRGGIHRRPSHLPWAHLAAFTAGLAVIVIALLSPIGANDERLLSMHMVSHDLLTWIAAPLLLPGAVPLLGGADRLPTYARRMLVFLTHPVVVLAVSTVLLWAWHAPPAYELALADETLHGVEHICFLIGYVLYWWPLIVRPGMVGWLRGHLARAVHLVVGMMQSALLGALITFHGSVLYTGYLHAPGATPTSALADQRLAGALMWFPGAFVFAVAAIFVLRRPTPGAVGVT